MNIKHHKYIKSKIIKILLVKTEFLCKISKARKKEYIKKNIIFLSFR